VAKLGIMIEGQEGLTWDRWRHICHDADALGFAALRRSEHFLSVMGVVDRDCIECWASLAMAAEWTKTVEIGPMVSPMTFRPPALLARMAAAVDQLSGGRLLLGVGAGWYEREHVEFGIPFPPSERERFDRLEEGIKVLHDTWNKSNPKPVHNPIPLLIGGKGAKRTLPLVAREATEWNYSTWGDPDLYVQRRGVLEELCHQIGRDPASIRRSIMTSYIIGRNRAELRERALKVQEIVTPPRIKSSDADAILEEQRIKWFVGTPGEIAEQMNRHGELGIDIFMLQHFLLEDRDALELLAKEVIPAIA
jgi:alkanesulfonate monooxygenase SsuD/methylene tetrahydromethanopterin reductase-like flavin-dependent oxidoreductase (luciferase family)